MQLRRKSQAPKHATHGIGCPLAVSIDTGPGFNVGPPLDGNDYAFAGGSQRVPERGLHRERVQPRLERRVSRAIFPLAPPDAPRLRSHAFPRSRGEDKWPKAIEDTVDAMVRRERAFLEPLQHLTVS